MKSEQFEDMSEEIEAFLNKLKAKFGSREFADKKMFKLNLNAFAVAEAYKKSLKLNFKIKNGRVWSLFRSYKILIFKFLN